MDLPLVGVTTYREHAQWGVWSQRADVLHVDYSDAVVRAGALPVLLPPAPAEHVDLLRRAAATAVRRVDALVVSGGADVDPRLYGEDPHPRTGAPREDRDAWELALLQAAATAGLPTLAVCRGMQLMVVAAGGSLHQHLPDLVGTAQHDPGGDAFGDHVVTTEHDTLIRRIEGEQVRVHCHHHQSVRHHPGFVVTARADDGCIEAVEGETSADRFVLGVQWHPEVNRDQRLFDALVEATGASPTARPAPARSPGR
jgi:putative glutamine amidotransferase